MELLLNLAWFAVAIVAFARLGIWATGQTDRRRLRAVTLATACVVVLLFPIISITDDLESSAAVVEESVAVRRAAAAAAHHALPILVAAATVCDLAIALTLLGFVTSKAAAVPSAPALPAIALRGPPLSGC